MRLGLFGGTFDPPHVGHLIAASDAHEALRLDRVLFIPAAYQPLKLEPMPAPADARLEMVREMLDGDARFGVDAVEIERGGLSYTVDTLQWYADNHADAERFFVMGADSLQSLESWREPGRVVALARVVVLTRTADETSTVTEEAVRQRVRALGGPTALEPVVVSTRRIDVSSTEIRARVREGRPIRGFVMEAVARYIESSGLYR